MKHVPLIIALLAALAVSGSAPVVASPELSAGVGRTFAASGLPDEGGWATSASIAWPLGEHDRFHVGVEGFADDLGTTLVQFTNPATGAALGTTAQQHRWVYGGAWLGDCTLTNRGGWSAVASATWGWHRLEDDQRGTTLRALSAVGLGAGLSVRRALAQGHALGLTVRWQQLFVRRGEGPAVVALATGDSPELDRRNLANHYATATLDWHWRTPNP